MLDQFRFITGKLVLFHDPRMTSLRPKDSVAWYNTDYAILRIESDPCAREVKRRTAVSVNCVNLLSTAVTPCSTHCNIQTAFFPRSVFMCFM